MTRSPARLRHTLCVAGLLLRSAACASVTLFHCANAHKVLQYSTFANAQADRLTRALLARHVTCSSASTASSRLFSTDDGWLVPSLSFSITASSCIVDVFLSIQYRPFSGRRCRIVVLVHHGSHSDDGAVSPFSHVHVVMVAQRRPVCWGCRCIVFNC